VARPRQPHTPPTRADVLRYLEGASADTGRNEILQALARGRGDRAAVKAILRELADEGSGRRRRKTTLQPVTRDAVPAIAVLDVTGIDADGELLLTYPGLPELRIVLPVENLEGTSPGVGDRVLARLQSVGESSYEARPIRVLPRQPREVTGIVEAAGDGMRIRSADRKARAEFVVARRDMGGAEPGDLVVASITTNRRLGLARAAVKERLGRPNEPAALTLMTAVSLGLPLTFPPEAEALARKARPVALGEREDLRAIPLVTIDGEDARDFDDAVWAAPDDAPDNEGGHRLLVAIADVAHYVRQNDALDREARGRGNSVYFPDRVIPMLPEALSNDLCSLRPEEDRACLAVRITIDRRGSIRGWRFCRGLMRSRARLTYRQVQAAKDGQADEGTLPLLDSVIFPLYAAFERLLAARHQRGTIELELPERRIVFDEAGRPSGIEARQRL
jgi:ribonuclease R